MIMDSLDARSNSAGGVRGCSRFTRLWVQKHVSAQIQNGLRLRCKPLQRCENWKVQTRVHEGLGATVATCGDVLCAGCLSWLALAPRVRVRGREASSDFGRMFWSREESKICSCWGCAVPRNEQKRGRTKGRKKSGLVGCVMRRQTRAEGLRCATIFGKV